jgi:tetratricopeptide (TPR) repeat protein
MARGAAQAQKRAKEKPQPKRKQRAAPSWEEQLFFSRLRRHAKVIYVTLAVVFAAGFVFLGVGSGSTGLGDILNGNFFGGGGGGTSSQIKDDQKKIERDPKDIAAYLDLAGLYQQDQNDSKALATLRRAETVAPSNLDVLNRIAGIYRGTAEQALTKAQNLQLAIQDSQITPPFVEASSTLGQALAQDPYGQSLTTQMNEAQTKATNGFRTAEAAYKRVAKAARGTSAEAGAQLQLGSVAASPVLADYPTAIAAFRRYLKLAPNGTNAAAVRQAIQQLQAALPKSQG